MTRFWILLIIILASNPAFPQNTSRSIEINEVTGLEIDGIPYEDGWKDIIWSKGFSQNFPSDTVKANSPTWVKMGYDDQNVYVAAICIFKKGEPRNTRTLRRDFDRLDNDAFTIAFDPTLDKNNGFIFSITPDGVLQEGLISYSSRTDDVWDNKWTAKTAVFDTCWTLEAKIPFKTLRYNAKQKQWGISFIRNEIASNEISVWNPVPREFDAISLGYSGLLSWPDNPPKPKLRVSAIPYITGGLGLQSDSLSSFYNAGLDLKTAVTPSLNLDVTINPDFSQAEVDRQVINLERFSVFFPERRNFFIENADLFSSFGFSKIRPFFSRRIGLSGDGKLVPIYTGARLSGKVNQDWRVGLLNVQTQSTRKDGLPQNYAVACFQRRTTGNSNLSGIFVNRQGVGEDWQDDYNRILGLDYNLLSSDNRWRGKVFYHQSFSSDNNNFQYAHASWLRHTERTWTAEWNHEFVSKHYQADVGFVPREGTGYWRLEPWIQKRFYPSSEVLNNHGPRFYYSLYTDENLDPTDSKIEFSYDVNFQNTTNLNFGVNNNYVRLTNPFNPNFNDTAKFEVGEYSWNRAFFSFNPSGRKLLNFAFYGNYGSFYKGYLASYGGGIQYRFPPYVRLGINMEMNQLIMPEPYLDDNLMLIRPTIDISFSKSVFLTSLFQLNRQTNTFTTNTRLQWRFAPMSDLFIVYNQQFDSESLVTQSQTILLKLNYWLNI